MKAFGSFCTIAKSPIFSILELENLPVVSRGGPAEAGEELKCPIGVNSDADSFSGLGPNKKGHAPMWKVVVTEIQDASAL